MLVFVVLGKSPGFVLRSDAAVPNLAPFSSASLIVDSYSNNVTEDYMPWVMGLHAGAETQTCPYSSKVNYNSWIAIR